MDPANLAQMALGAAVGKLGGIGIPLLLLAALAILAWRSLVRPNLPRVRKR